MNINDVLNLNSCIPFRYDEPPPKNALEAFWQWLVSRALFFSLECSSLRLCPDLILPRCIAMKLAILVVWRSFLLH